MYIVYQNDTIYWYAVPERLIIKIHQKTNFDKKAIKFGYPAS